MEITSEQTFVIARSPNSQDHTFNKKIYPSTFQSETSEIAILLTSTQDDQTTISSSSLKIPPTSESISNITKIGTLYPQITCQQNLYKVIYNIFKYRIETLSD